MMKEGRKERWGSMKTDRVGREGGRKMGEGSEEERRGRMRRGGGITRTGLFRFSSWSLTPVQTRNCTLYTHVMYRVY